uniref:Uncharacterized protein n=1 Tax=Strigamia maritima TaxID=126957 RepID=T1J134_STRMM
MAPTRKAIYQAASIKCGATDVFMGYVEKTKTKWSLTIDLRDKIDPEINVNVEKNRVQISGRFKQDKNPDSQWVYVKQEQVIPFGYILTARISERYRIMVIAIRENCQKDSTKESTTEDTESASESDPDDRICPAKKVCVPDKKLDE